MVSRLLPARPVAGLKISLRKYSIYKTNESGGLENRSLNSLFNKGRDHENINTGRVK